MHKAYEALDIKSKHILIWVNLREYGGNVGKSTKAELV
jgi:hypothetical protein